MRVTLGELAGKLPFKQGPWNRLRPAAGATAALRGRALRDASNRGGS